MKTRHLPLIVCALAASAGWTWAQTAPEIDPAAPPAATPPSPPVEAAAPAGPEVVIKEDPAAPAATKSRDAAGHDTLSVDFPEEDIRNILRNVADLFELNLVIPEALQGKASIKLRDVTWRQIFQVVLAPVNFTYLEDGNIIKIVSNDSLAQEPVSTEVFMVNYARAADIKPTIESLVDPAAGGKLVVDTRSNSLVITERPTRMNRIRPIIEQLDRATDQVMIESKFIEINDGDVRNLGVNWASLRGYSVGAGPFSGTYDRASGGSRTTTSDGGTASTNGTTSGTSSGTTNGTTGSQTSGATTSSSIASTNGVPSSGSTTTSTGGLNSTTTASTTSGTQSGTNNAVTETMNLLTSLAGGKGTDRTLSAVFSADQFGLVLSALNELSTSKVVSNPTIVTLNNAEAIINIGKEYPIPAYTYNEQRGSFEVSGFAYKPIGINLKVTPQVNGRGFIKLTVEPEVSSFNDADSVNFGGATGAKIPVIQTKKAKTQISLKDGFTMGIGGLIDSTMTNGESKVPLLGSIPGLGYLFKSKSKTTSTRNLLIFLTAKTLSAEGAPPEQIFDPRQIKQMELKRSDLPGYREGVDPFQPETAPVDPKAKKKKGWFGGKKTQETP